MAPAATMDGLLNGLVIILGSPNDSCGTISAMGQGRLRTGFEAYQRLKPSGYRILVTGGFGDHFNTTGHPHAYHAREYLIGLGAAPEDIVEFAESRNTVDDALQSRPIVDRYQAQKLLVVTSDFHLDRARFIFAKVFPDNEITFLGSPYLTTCSPEDQVRLLAHEQREIESLQATGCSIVGGALSVDSWRRIDG